MGTSERCKVGSLNFDVTTIDKAIEQTIDNALAGRGEHVHLANAWSIALANEDSSLEDAFNCGRNYPDGKPVVWAMRRLRGRDTQPAPGRVYGPTFFERTIEEGVSRGVRHYFLGSTPETLEKLQTNLRTRFPGVELVGASSPPFKPALTAEDFDIELSKIEACQPDIVWVGLGTPKQDFAAAYLSPRYSAIFACVGACFDFTAGNLRDVPVWIQELGLAWLMRLIQEPRRLWHRYTYGNAKFLQIVARQLTAKYESGRLTPR
jgi:N-acetylglucosaminyldiphosphoundecaprenol N-acetyl-beta-D-mannosaminyltransferase